MSKLWRVALDRAKPILHYRRFNLFFANDFLDRTSLYTASSKFSHRNMAPKIYVLWSFLDRLSEITEEQNVVLSAALGFCALVFHVGACSYFVTGAERLIGACYISMYVHATTRRTTYT